MTTPQLKKILVVDDDVRLRELLQRYLTEQGFSVKVVADAKEMDTALANNDVEMLAELQLGVRKDGEVFQMQ